MFKIKKSILIFSFVTLLSLISFKQVYAATGGTFKCAWRDLKDTKGGTLAPGCQPAATNFCDTSTTPNITYVPDTAKCWEGAVDWSTSDPNSIKRAQEACEKKPYYTCKERYTSITPTPIAKQDVFLCVSGSCRTALGKIETTPDGFIVSLLNWALPLAVFVTLVGLIYAGYQVLISQGNPEKLQAAKELIVSVISGLLLLIFSFAILQVIGGGFLGIK